MTMAKRLEHLERRSPACHLTQEAYIGAEALKLISDEDLQGLLELQQDVAISPSTTPTEGQQGALNRLNASMQIIRMGMGVN